MSRIPKAVRAEVREQAEGRCEYCQLHERHSLASFHVDHILPVKGHGGSDALVNLAWACVNCNKFKLNNVAGYDPLSEALTPLFNPRTEVWSDHFELVEGYILGRTAIGRVTVAILNLNQLDRARMRRILVEIGEW
jgi:hypothetical protein